MGESVKTFRDLKVWKRAHQLVIDIYGITKTFPTEERFGLIVQLRRSAASIPSNIVEGHKRRSRKDFLHFLNVAESSLEETKYHIILSKDLEYLGLERFKVLMDTCDEVGRMLCGLQKSLTP